MPVWAKLTPATSDIALEAGAVFRGGADAVVSSNTFPSLPLIDPETLEFEMNVDGLVSSGGLGGPAILPLSLAKMAEMTQRLPREELLGHRRHLRLRATRSTTSCSAAARSRSAPRPCSTTRSGPNVIKRLIAGARSSSRRTREGLARRLEDFRGLRRDRVVPHSQIRRPDDVDYQGGHEPQEGYAEPTEGVEGQEDLGGASMSTTLVRTAPSSPPRTATTPTSTSTRASITLIGQGLNAARRHRDRRLGQARDARRDRRPHAPRHAVRRHDLGRRLRDAARSRRPTAAPRRSSTSRSRASARASTPPSRAG